MKWLLISFLSLTMILSNSCKKETETSSKIKLTAVSPSALSVAGTWELRQSMSQIGTINYPAGNGLTLAFTESSYTVTDKDQTLMALGNQPEQGRYQVMSDTTVTTCVGLLFPAGQFTNRIILNGDTRSDKIFYEVQKNQLMIVSGYFPTDGGRQLTFEKQ